MSTVITVLHIIVCLFLMLTVLLQSGKGGGMGAAFGGGNAATVFGGSGASGFLKRLTAIAGTIFMMTSMVLAFLSSQNSADALDRFGKDQQQIATEKEAAKTRALKAAKAGSGSGSGSAGSGSTFVNPIAPLNSGSNNVEAPIMEPPPPDSGSATKPDAPKPGAGSAAKPDAPKPGTGSAAKPDAPKPGAGSAAKPDAPKPAAPKPDAPKPDAPKPAGGSAAKPAVPAGSGSAK